MVWPDQLVARTIATDVPLRLRPAGPLRRSCSNRCSCQELDWESTGPEEVDCRDGYDPGATRAGQLLDTICPEVRQFAPVSWNMCLRLSDLEIVSRIRRNVSAHCRGTGQRERDIRSGMDRLDRYAS